MATAITTKFAIHFQRPVRQTNTQPTIQYYGKHCQSLPTLPQSLPLSMQPLDDQPTDWPNITTTITEMGPSAFPSATESNTVVGSPQYQPCPWTKNKCCQPVPPTLSFFFSSYYLKFSQPPTTISFSSSSLGREIC